MDRDGPTFIGDPELGFSGLRTFGPSLIHHSKLKIRSNVAIKNFMIVDTPGMIDSPMVRDAVTGTSKYAVMDRGYDFEGVCRWYAQRADVILLFFDPDKPGTTGETLSILTNSLVGLDHKLHIVLNKADQFRKIHDFARAYGSLCWNLSKVIQRKDLPMIHTMCLPKNYQSHQHGNSMGQAENSDSSIAQGLADLESTREDVVQEVLNAPKRRVDNEISRLTDSVGLLQMHLNIVDELSKQYKNALFRSRLTLGLTGSTSVGAVVALALLGMPPEIIAGVTVSGAVGSGGLFWWQMKDLRRQSGMLATESAMNAAFQKIYSRRIVEKDESIISMWRRVQDHLTLTLSSEDVAGLDKVTAAHTSELDRILEVEIPNLRRKAAPAFNRTI